MIKNIKFSFQKQSQFHTRSSPLILRDLKQSGKERPWRKNKLLSLAISKAYFSLSELEKYGEVIVSCGNSLKFASCGTAEHGKKLIRASFCKSRLCSMCQWRKSLVVRRQVLDLLHWHGERYSTDVPLLLTLTVVNVPGDELGRTISLMHDAWQRLMERKVVKKAVRSSFRSLEITYNRERQDFHPHFHALLMVPKSYFDTRCDFYISQQEWLRLWKASMRDDRITQIDIRTIRAGKKGKLESMAAEVAKYATKPSSYVEEKPDGSLEASPSVVADLHYALKGRRLIGFGGLFKKLREEKKVVDVEEADLIHIDEDGVVKESICKICGSTLLEELYRWDAGLRQYCKVNSSCLTRGIDIQHPPPSSLWGAASG
jgi:plasmid rolling circle replication initiator protein Rep